MKSLLAGLSLLLSAVTLHSQTNSVEQFIQLAKGYKLSDRWSADARTELRLSWYETDENVDLQWDQFYLQGGTAYALNANWIIGLSYRLSRRGSLESRPDMENRIVQQIAATQRLRKVRLREHLKLEQRIFSDETVHRWRFRTAVDFPLSGERLDIGEWYLNQQFTFLLEPFEPSAWSSREFRLYAGAGTLLPESSRLELGIESRWGRNDTADAYDSRWILRSTWSF